VLAGFHLRDVGPQRAGQIQLRDRSGAGFELRAGRLAGVRADAMTLAGGHVLRLDNVRRLTRAGAVVARFAPPTHLELDGSGDVLTAIRLDDAGRALGRSIARDLGSGTSRSLPRGCRAGDESGGVRFELCGYPWGPGLSRILRVDADGRRMLRGPAERRIGRPAGWWQSLALSPSGDRLLAQWSGECETPAAYFVDARSGRSTNLGRALGQTESRALGWSSVGAIVSLPARTCAGAPGRPGIYALDSRGHGKLLHPLFRSDPDAARLWR
jgi:hypothetical protein